MSLKNILKCLYSFMTVVSFNDVKSPVDFRIPEDTNNIVVLRSLLDNLLSYTENRKVCKIEFCAPWINIEGNVKYNNIKLKIDEDLKVMWRAYRCRQTKGPIEFDDIIKMLKRPKSSSSVQVLLFIIILASYVIVVLCYIIVMC